MLAAIPELALCTVSSLLYWYEVENNGFFVDLSAFSQGVHLLNFPKRCVLEAQAAGDGESVFTPNL